MQTRTVKGYYGSGNTPCLVLVADTHDGGAWYCVEGSHNVNFTYDPIGLGMDVETLADVDTSTADKPINDEDELIQHIEA